MSNKDLARVVLGLSADVNQLKRDMNKGNKVVEGSTLKMQRATERAAKGMDNAMTRASARIGRMGTSAFRGLTAGAVAALAPILSVGAALRTAQSALADFDKLGNRAAMLGTNVEALQEFHYAAGQAGMQADNFDMALRRMTRRAAEAAQGTGAAVGAFKELGVELHDQEGRLKANDVLLREVADKLQKVPDHADRLRLAFKMFDTDGAQMVNVLANGSAGLDEFAAKARSLGLVVDEHLIVRAQELKSEFDTATTVLNRQFQQALVSLAPFLVQTAQLAANVASAVRDIGDALQYWSGNLGNVSGSGLSQLHAQLGVERVQIEAKMLQLESDLRNVGFDPMGWATNDINSQLEQYRARLTEIADEEARINTILLNRPTLSTPGTPDFSTLLDDDPITPGGGGGGRNAAADAAIRQAEAVQRVVDNLIHEREQLSRTAEEQELYNLLKAAGVERESEFGQAIESALGPLQAQRAAIEANAEAMAQFRDAASSAMNTFVDDLMAGKSAAESLGNVLANLGKQMLSMGINSLANMLVPGAGAMSGAGGGHIGSTFKFSEAA